jgi:hypothetical protein
MVLSDSYYSNDDDTYGAENSPSVNIQCTSSSSIPLQTGTYDVMKAYIEDSTTCDGKNSSNTNTINISNTIIITNATTIITRYINDSIRGCCPW